MNIVAAEPTQGAAVSLRASYFNADALQAIAGRLAPEYRRARPFPHVVIDDFLPAEHLHAVVDELERAGGVRHTQQFDNAAERKLATDDASLLPPRARHLLSELNSATFVAFLETLTGIDGVIPDPHFTGGGFHEIKRGGFLKVHTDFNRHRRLRLDRRLNFLLYLNRDWKEEYGGHLELWGPDMRSCEKRILPIFNRCVVFSTTDSSYHGHPEPLICPDDVSRRSLALYYYTSAASGQGTAEYHGTVFRARPGEPARAQARMLLQRAVPPLALDAARNLRHWRARRGSR